jgi:hypothetical protein
MERTQTKIDREYRRRHPASALEKSTNERFDSGTHLAHKTRSEDEFLGCFKSLPLIGKSGSLARCAIARSFVGIGSDNHP